MTMTPRLRKFALTVHIASSVGWLGSVAGFLALAIAGLTSRDVQTVRGIYVAMQLTGWYVIVPLPRFADNRAYPVTRHTVGLVPALLGLDEIPDNHRFHPHLVRFRADT